MLYTSTRGRAEAVTASQGVIRGMAGDGGLYVPERIPAFGWELDRLAHMDYKDIAKIILSAFFSDYSPEEVEFCVESAYSAGFDSPNPAPLKKACGIWFLELFHGRTLAFKDMALSIHPYLMVTAMKKNGDGKRMAVLAATSGDTGKAAMAGFADVPGTDIIVFYPKGGVSPIQELQMLTQEGKNVCVAAIEGNFDDAQTGVKNIFGDMDFRKRLEDKGILLSSANSINIGRLIPQIAYYFHAYGQMLREGAVKAGENVNFAVPTGNFGNILAGWYAKNMGLPVNRLVCATNPNKVLFDYFHTGDYNRNREFLLTASPSMDILVSSNLERLLYHIRGAEETEKAMKELDGKGFYSLDLGDCGIMSQWAGEEESFAAIQKCHGQGYTMDTHTAVAYSAWEKYGEESGDSTKTVVVSTASPYKFPESVTAAITGRREASAAPGELVKRLHSLTGIPIPQALAGIEERPLLHNTVCKKGDMTRIVENYLQI